MSQRDTLLLESIHKTLDEILEVERSSLEELRLMRQGMKAPTFANVANWESWQRKTPAPEGKNGTQTL